MINPAFDLCLSGKVEFGSENLAWAYAYWVHRWHRAVQSPYRCPQCGRWHLTTVRHTKRFNIQ